MNESKSQRPIELAGDAAVILAFGCVFVGAGHGIDSIGLILIASSLKGWGLPLAAGRTGIALVAISTLIPRRGQYVTLELAGLALIVVSWLLFITSQSGSLILSLVFSIPFLVALATRLVFFILQLRGH